MILSGERAYEVQCDILILCDSYNEAYNVRIYTASYVTFGEYLKIYILLLEIHGNLALSNSRGANVASAMYIFDIMFIIVYIIYRKHNHTFQSKWREL